MMSSMDVEGDTKSHRQKESRRRKRAETGSEKLFAEWVRRQGDTVGARQLPREITILACGCSRPSLSESERSKMSAKEIKKFEQRSRLALRVTRSLASEPWSHLGCAKQDEPGSGHS
jgi:hypothetical protein